MLEIDYKKVFEDLQKVPEVIRDAISSEKATNHILDIIDRHKLSEEVSDAIPRALVLLETKNLPAGDLINFLAEQLKVDLASAKKIASDLYTYILRPVRKELADWGVNLESIPINEVKEPIPIQPPKPKNKEKEEGPIIGELKPIIEPTLPVEDEEKKIEDLEESPLIIEAPGQSNTFNAPNLAKDSRKSSFSFSFGRFFKPGKASAEPNVKAEVTLDNKPNQENKKKKIVHYSEYRTPLETGEKKENQPPAVKQSSGEKVKLDGTTIDLRNK